VKTQIAEKWEIINLIANSVLAKEHMVFFILVCNYDPSGKVFLGKDVITNESVAIK